MNGKVLRTTVEPMAGFRTRGFVLHVDPLASCCKLLASVGSARPTIGPAGRAQRDLVWRETGIVDKLPAGPLPRVWSTPIAEGYSGPAVANGRVYITDRQHEKQNERVLCLDAATGKSCGTTSIRRDTRSVIRPARVRRRKS